MAAPHQVLEKNLKIVTSKEEPLRVGIATGNQGDEPTERFTAEQTKALLRKLDLHMIPYLSLLYLLSFLE